MKKKEMKLRIKELEACIAKLEDHVYGPILRDIETLHQAVNMWADPPIKVRVDRLEQALIDKDVKPEQGSEVPECPSEVEEAIVSALVSAFAVMDQIFPILFSPKKK